MGDSADQAGCFGAQPSLGSAWCVPDRTVSAEQFSLHVGGGFSAVSGPPGFWRVSAGRGGTSQVITTLESAAGRGAEYRSLRRTRVSTGSGIPYTHFRGPAQYALPSTSGQGGNGKAECSARRPPGGARADESRCSQTALGGSRRRCRCPYVVNPPSVAASRCSRGQQPPGRAVPAGRRRSVHSISRGAKLTVGVMGERALRGDRDHRQPGLLRLQNGNCADAARSRQRRCRLRSIPISYAEAMDMAAAHRALGLRGANLTSATTTPPARLVLLGK